MEDQMSLPETIRLTKLEREILNHRLDVPDCICEAIEQPFDLVYRICGLLYDGKVSEAYAINPEVAAACLLDAVEGSTYYGASDGESPQRLAAIERASLSLAKKVSQFTGTECEAPLC